MTEPAPTAAAEADTAPPPPVPLPPVMETGHAAVDGALARLAAIGDVPAEVRAGVYGEVHDLLRDTLAGLEERPGQAPTPLNALG
ncbi:hypothetical protein [Streptacidiphilus sp. MAP5-3]|uniref:hypothetical protein n=1 Tax=unclassified Streptacidiphilus TaxID=2643834 RepID=UPI003514CC33